MLFILLFRIALCKFVLPSVGRVPWDDFFFRALRYLFGCLQKAVELKWKDFPEVKTRVVRYELTIVINRCCKSCVLVAVSSFFASFVPP